MRQPEEGTSPAGPDADAPTEITRAEDDWPVAPQYRVTPKPSEPSPEEGAPQDAPSAVVVGPPRRRLVPSGPAAVAAAVLAFLVLLGAAAAWLVAYGESSQASAPPPAGQTTAAPTATTTPAVSTAPVTTTATSTTSTSEETPQVAVPSVVGLTVGDARRELRDAGLRPRTRLSPSSEEAGTVIAQDPNESEQVAPGSIVSLVVAQREAPATVRMPSLVGSTAADAKSRLRELGLHWSVSEVASDEARLTVVGQTPAAGTEVRKGQTVTLRVSTGPALVAVPEVTGLDEKSARDRLEAAGFDVAVVDRPTSDPAEDGTVVGQDPIGGTKADKGSSVTITVARLS